MAIVTTSKAVDFNLIHRDRTIVTHMDFVLTREDYTNSKPDPEPYELALTLAAGGHVAALAHVNEIGQLGDTAHLFQFLPLFLSLQVDL